MNTKIIEMNEAINFAKNNGYLLAIYEFNKDTNNYELVDETNFEQDFVSENDDILVSIEKDGSIDFNEFTTRDKKYVIRLHNNFNIPKIIPLINFTDILYE